MTHEFFEHAHFVRDGARNHARLDRETREAIAAQLELPPDILGRVISAESPIPTENEYHRIMDRVDKELTEGWSKAKQEKATDNARTIEPAGTTDTPECSGPPTFEGFPKIPRLFRDIIITEKIDGTNAQVLVTKGRQVFAGSRRRWLTPGNDNFGFAAWVQENTDELQQLGPGRHYGEWWGRGINRGYGLDERRFSLFNVTRWRNWLPFASWGGDEPQFAGDEKRTPIPMCCHLVPILYAGPWYDESAILQYGEEPRVIKNILYRLSEPVWGSVAAPGYAKPEGIVIYHSQSNLLFKVTLKNDEKPKGVA